MVQKGNVKPTLTSNIFLHKPEDIVKLTLNSFSWNSFAPICVLMTLYKKLVTTLGVYSETFKLVLPLPQQSGSIDNRLLIGWKIKVFDCSLSPIIICSKIPSRLDVMPL